MCVKPVVLNHSLLFVVKGGSWQLNHVTCFKQFWQARKYWVDQSSWMYWNLFLAVTDESILLDSRWSGLYTWKENKATAARGREERTSVNTQQQADDNCRVCCGMWGFLETLLHVACCWVSLKNGSVAHASLQSQSHFSISWLHWFFFFFLLLKWKSHHSHESERSISFVLGYSHLIEN